MAMEAKHYELKILDPDELRPCGDCQACCTAMAVREIEKNNYQRCEHQCSEGCGIYQDRPASCRAFNCGYEAGWIRDRPDKTGVIVDYNAILNCIFLWEGRIGASNYKKVNRLINRLKKLHSTASIHIVTKKNAPSRSICGTEEYKQCETAAEMFYDQMFVNLAS
ncbi:hypothetical protein [Bremerella alba]|uniref:Uncharacterized protein n=1 Tax=Bremerella alba TaxID=980252 RepID=A0A7V9A8Q6_9BACT|nr:hypothetical protein [Bremerella alba]MBA2116735.1 hypothetical protein [Bremerella alba]